MSQELFLEIISEWSVEFNNTLLENNSIYVALFDESRKLMFANGSMETLFKGDAVSNLLNPDFDKLLSLDNSKPLIFEGFLTIGDIYSVNTSIWSQIYRKNSRILIIGGVNTTQLLEQNAIMHSLNNEINNLQRKLIKEKQSLKALYEQLNEANHELEMLNDDKDRFMSILAHDLRNPFNSLLGLSDLLKNNLHRYKTEQIEAQVIRINVSANKAFSLLEDLLTWVRSQSGKIPFAPESVSLVKIVKHVFDDIKEIAEQKQIELVFLEKLDISVFADKNMLKTILRNLISNAVKFTHPGGKVIIEAEKDDNGIIVSVADSGIGMTKEDIKKLFDTSVQHTTPGTQGEKGTGLGLLICKDFVVKHGGKLMVESNSGEGSTFKFFLPE